MPAAPPPPQADDDTDALLALASGGDSRALSRLLDRHRGRLKRMVLVRLDDRIAARIDPSDVVQDTLIEAAANLHRAATVAAVLTLLLATFFSIGSSIMVAAAFEEESKHRVAAEQAADGEKQQAALAQAAAEEAKPVQRLPDLATAGGLPRGEQFRQGGYRRGDGFVARIGLSTPRSSIGRCRGRRD